MLKFLSIRDFVIVSSLELEFSAGFTALTGETGAGKSILIDALLMTLGERGDASMVRAGCERAEISAEFDSVDCVPLQDWLHRQDMSGDDGMCLMRRLLDKGGRSRGFINGRSATLQQMREVGEYVLNIHGQHAHQALLRTEAQRELLDGYAGLQLLVVAVAGHYRDWQALKKRRVHLLENAQTLAAERELLQFQRGELESLAFNTLAWQTLQTEYARLAHASGLLESAAFGIESLSDSDTACLSQLNILIARLREGLVHDTNLAEPLQLLESAQADLQEVVYSLRHYQQRLDADPQQLAEKEHRIQEVMDISRKYRTQPEQLQAVLEQIILQLKDLGDDADLAELVTQEKVAHRVYLECARLLTSKRVMAAEKLSQEITEAMQRLAMQGGCFSVVLQPLSEGNAFGLETIEFQVAANPGTPARSMAKVASGGELSRISLAIQVATSQTARVPTLIFDEVDSGIGGRVAEIVGLLLKQLGREYQVLCVTHLPQVAAMADSQWQVSKTVMAGVTLSQIEVLTSAQRVQEIARMLGGVTITDTTRQHAAEMLDHAA
jgi:DNA repair protein RecN (Recombination protein N)